MTERKDNSKEEDPAQMALEAANQALAAAKVAVTAAVKALALSSRHHEQDIAEAPLTEAPIVDGLAAPPAAVEAPTVAHLVEAANARQEAGLRERQFDIASRQAAMGRYAPMGPARSVPARPQAQLNGYTVLVVDDEEQVRALTVRILTRYGYRVLEASGAEIALGLLDEPTANVDLVLSDVAMPRLSGQDLFRVISESRPGLPVALMSGYALGVYAPEGLIEEGVKVLPKPFTQEDLLGFVTEALEGAAAR